MNGGYFIEALVFLIRTVFELYLLAVALRFLFQLVRVDFYNPLAQFLVKITNPALKPIRRLVRGYKGIDWSSVILMIIIKSVQISVIAVLVSGRFPVITGLLIISIAEILKLIIYIFMVSVFIQVILSWVSPGTYNPITLILYQLTEPIMRPARRVIQPVGGLDLSPLLVFIVLQLMIILIVNPIWNTGYVMAGLRVFSIT
jgi:YggT family protein